MWQVDFYLGDVIIDKKEYETEQQATEAGERHNMRYADDEDDDNCAPSFHMHEDNKKIRTRYDTIDDD